MLRKKKNIDRPTMMSGFPIGWDYLASWLNIPDDGEQETFFEYLWETWEDKSKRTQKRRLRRRPLTRLIRHIDNLAVKGQPKRMASKDEVAVLACFVGPYFNQSPRECMDWLDAREADCASPVAASLIAALKNHYGEVLSFGEEILSNLGRD